MMCQGTSHHQQPQYCFSFCFQNPGGVRLPANKICTTKIFANKICLGIHDHLQHSGQKTKVDLEKKRPIFNPEWKLHPPHTLTCKQLCEGVQPSCFVQRSAPGAGALPRRPGGSLVCCPTGWFLVRLYWVLCADLRVTKKHIIPSPARLSPIN